MRVGIVRGNLKTDGNHRLMIPCGEKWRDRTAIPHHQFKAWKTTFYGRLNDIRKDKRPSSGEV